MEKKRNFISIVSSAGWPSGSPFIYLFLLKKGKKLTHGISEPVSYSEGCEAMKVKTMVNNQLVAYTHNTVHAEAEKEGSN